MFEVKKPNESGFFENLNAKVTIKDHDSRTFRFNNHSVNDVGFFVEHMFSDNGEHISISQLYSKGSAFSTSSFDLLIPHSPPPPSSSPSGNSLTGLFKQTYQDQNQLTTQRIRVIASNILLLT